MNKKDLIRIITGILILLSVFGIILFIYNLDIGCIFRKYLHIPCPACGMTRAFRSIFKLDFISAFKYNVLSIPLFLSLIIFFIVYLVSLFTKKDYIIRLFKIYTKHPLIIIILLIISFIYNLNRY